MKIAILRCLHSNDVCAGAACLRALNNKTASFAQYGEEPLELVAYFSCNGCGKVAFNCEKGMAGKIETIKRLAPDAVHFGICTKMKDSNGERKQVCPNIVRILDELKAAGIRVVDGTH